MLITFDFLHLIALILFTLIGVILLFCDLIDIINGVHSEDRGTGLKILIPCIIVWTIFAIFS